MRIFGAALCITLFRTIRWLPVTLVMMSMPQLLQAAPSEDDAMNDLFELSFEQLANLDFIVETASKRAEKISDAPGIITVMTADDIRRFGSKKLSDVLSRFPNVYMWGSEVLRNNVASIRGGTPTHGDTHTLILLNGRPMRDSLGGINLLVYEDFPVEAIDHIEMVRGPGSVLYGSSAFSGVINIITKSAADIKKNQVSIGGGAFNSGTVSALGALKSKDFSTVAAINARNADGWDTPPFIDANGVRGSYEHGQKVYSGLLQTSYKDLKLSVYTSDVTTDRLGAAVRFPSSRNRRQKQFLDAGYSYDLSQNWAVNINGTLNNYYQKGVGVSTEGRLFEIGMTGTAWEKITLTTGAKIENHYAEQVTNAQQIYDDVTWYGYYAQADYYLTDRVKLIAGFQFNKPEDSEADFVPRLGMVMNFTPEWGAKFLYGHAFRAPYAGERASNFNYLVGNPVLRPETIATADAQLFYIKDGRSSALTVYKSVNKDAITRTNTIPITFVNSGDIQLWGIEWEGRAKLAQHWDLLGSVSYQAGEDEQGYEDIGVVPHYMAKAGLSYNSRTGYQVGLFNSYYSEAARIEEISSAAVVNSSAEGYHWLTANASLDLYQRSGNPVMLNIYIENLLDQDVYFPEIFSKEINTTPLRGGRAAYATVTIKF